MQSWIHVLEWRATVHPDVTVLVDDRARVTPTAACAPSSSGGLRLGRAGVSPGDVVAVVAKNSADFLLQAFALLRAGATRARQLAALAPRACGRAGAGRADRCRSGR